MLILMTVYDIICLTQQRHRNLS